jgi:hypothetical protein
MILERVGLVRLESHPDSPFFRWHLHGEVPFTGYKIDHAIEVDAAIVDRHGWQRELYEVRQGVDAVKAQAKERGFDVDWSGVDAKLADGWQLGPPAD